MDKMRGYSHHMKECLCGCGERIFVTYTPNCYLVQEPQVLAKYECIARYNAMMDSFLERATKGE